MKKVIIGSLLSIGILSADVVTLLPYYGQIDYDNDTAKSAKDRSQLYGLYASIGNLDYLLEASYGYMDTSYKDTTLKDLNQHDISLIYGSYYDNFMFKIGGHYIDTNDKDLGDGYVIALTLGGYKFVDYDKYSYGLEGYYSKYDKGHDENYKKKSISLIQLTPYLSIFNTFSSDTKNSLDFRLNYIIANDYLKKDYTSYEISDTLYYKSFFTTLKAYFGKMRTGVKDGGMTVFNTLDLIKDGYSVKMGYYFTKDFIFSASYGINNYEEYSKTTDGTNSMILTTLSYSF